MPDKEKNTSSSVQNADTQSPFYLHPSDCPGQLHVTEQLHDGNYAEWADEISNFLLAKNKVGIIDGSVPTPKEGEVDHESRKRCNTMIRRWLMRR